MRIARLALLPLVTAALCLTVSASEAEDHAQMDHAGDDHAAMGHADGGGHADHHGAHEPVGIMVGHMLEEPMSFMLAYRFQYARANGDMLRGSTPATDMEVMTQACQPNMCMMAPEQMSMQMHMIEFMFAPTSWLNFMIMPQFMSMDMSMRPLQTGAMGGMMSSTGGVGDLRMDVIVKLLREGSHRLHLGLGVTAPTGSVTETIVQGMNPTPVLTHYGMQLGSGTWDLVPTLTYSGQRSGWNWGAQLGAVARLESSNESGYSLGHRFNGHLWGGYALTSWLLATLRTTYAWQGDVSGEYDAPHSVMSSADYPSNYGGHFFDMGFGLQFNLPTRFLDAHSIGIEWAQPLVTDFNGYQLDRVGALNVGWMLHF